MFYIPMMDKDRIGAGYSPSTQWYRAGPIIERERVVVVPAAGQIDDDPWEFHCWQAQTFQDHLNDNLDERSWFDGETILIAAMRCYVASKLGSVVDIPAELVSK